MFLSRRGDREIMKRKVILNLAISLDGYISDEDGGYDWIVGHGDQRQNTVGEFSFLDFMKNLDVVLMGRRAFEDNGIQHLQENGIEKILVASRKSRPSEGSVEFISNPLEVVGKLKKEEGKNIWLFGGALLTDEFIKADIIDEYIIGIIPAILGRGRKLFRSEYPGIALHLEESTVQDGIVILRYTKRDKGNK